METTSPEKYEQKLHEFNINVKLYYEHEKIIFDFLSSKFKAMEKMNLNLYQNYTKYKYLKRKREIKKHK